MLSHTLYHFRGRGGERQSSWLQQRVVYGRYHSDYEEKREETK
jgi:hypothetical protein